MSILTKVHLSQAHPATHSLEIEVEAEHPDAWLTLSKQSEEDNLKALSILLMDYVSLTGKLHHEIKVISYIVLNEGEDAAHVKVTLSPESWHPELEQNLIHESARDLAYTPVWWLQTSSNGKYWEIQKPEFGDKEQAEAMGKRLQKRKGPKRLQYQITEKPPEFQFRPYKPRFTATLSHRIEEDKLLIDVTYASPDGKDVPFRFGNASKGLERNALRVLGPDGERLKKTKRGFIKPRESKVHQTVLNAEETFVYTIRGKISQRGDEVMIDFSTAGYLLKPGISYKICLEYKGELSNEIILTF